MQPTTSTCVQTTHVFKANYDLAPGFLAVQLCILDTGPHAAPVGLLVIMIFCTIAACSQLLPAGIQELVLCTLKIAGEIEVVAFDKIKTLTGSLISMLARPGVE